MYWLYRNSKWWRAWVLGVLLQRTQVSSGIYVHNVEPDESLQRRCSSRSAKLNWWQAICKLPLLCHVIIADSRITCAGMVFGSYLNYAIHGPEYKSDWAERGWACESSDYRNIHRLHRCLQKVEFSTWSNAFNSRQCHICQGKPCCYMMLTRGNLMLCRSAIDTNENHDCLDNNQVCYLDPYFMCRITRCCWSITKGSAGWDEFIIHRNNHWHWSLRLGSVLCPFV